MSKTTDAATEQSNKKQKPSFFDIEPDGGLRGVRDWPKAARWVAVPFVWLITTLLLFMALSWGVSIFHINPDSNLYLYVLQPAFGIFGQFICVSMAAATAPSRRTITALVFGILYVALGVSLGIKLGLWVNAVLPLLGSVLAVNSVRKQEKHRNAESL